MVTRESEWNDYARSRALAIGAWEQFRCGVCGNWDALVPLSSDTRHVTWEQHDNRKVEVAQFRCVFCGAAELIKRDSQKRHEKDDPQAGTAAWGDGRIYVARPLTEEA